MNRNEAYEILIQIMKDELENYRQLSKLIEPETSRTSKDGGLYTISLEIKEPKDRNPVLKGAIRGNNPQKFEILEEEIEIEG